MILLIAGAGILSFVLPMQIAQARKRVEPEVVIRPQNTFEKTLRVVGDIDYKPFSFFHDGESDPHGYDIEIVSELANRMGVNLDLQLMEWKDAVDQLQEKRRT